MKDAVDLLSERIADLKERNKALVQALEAMVALFEPGRAYQFSELSEKGTHALKIAYEALKEHGGE